MKEPTVKPLYQYACEKDMAGYQMQFSKEVTFSEKEWAYEVLGEVMTISCDPDDLHNSFEFCLGKDAGYPVSKGNGIFVEWSLIDFIEPALIEGNGRFVYTSYDLIDVETWHKTVLEFKKLAAHLRSAQSMEDIHDYFFEISPTARGIICVDFEKFQKKFPIFLDELIGWFEKAFEQDDAIWIRGL